jgi:hypothetical protein
MINSAGRYSSNAVASIIKGYRLLDSSGHLSSLLRLISNCDKCSLTYPQRPDKPISCLVRSLPLSRLSISAHLSKYPIRIKRDDTFLRNLFQSGLRTEEIRDKLGSAKFSIGLNPWLDRCMLFRRSKKTKLMIIGIDYKHFPVFHRQKRDHNFPLDSYKTQNNIWGPTWRKFFRNILGEPYSDERVNAFLKDYGVFMTNSMLCFGGSDNPSDHFYGYLECCRNHIAEMIKIVKPEVIVSFGNYGCKNVVSIMVEGGNDDPVLHKLSKSRTPLKEMKSVVRSPKYAEGIKVRFEFKDMVFWPLYQPARSHIYSYDHDYDNLRELLAL